MKTKMIAATLLALPFLFLSSCKKDNGNGNMGTGYMDARMMDAPSPYAYQAVKVDVQRVEVNIVGSDASEAGSWVTLQTTGGVYDLLHYTNGLDTLIASSPNVPSGRVTQMRLILGTNNSVTYLGQTYPMDVPSGSETGIKVNINQRTGGGPLHLLLDFDAAQSVIQHGNGTFSLKPVIHAFLASETGTVVGSISQTGPAWAITFSGRESVYSTYADPISGHFMVRGLAAGAYEIKVYRADNDIPISLGTVTVTAGNTTDLGLLVVGH